MPVKYVGVRNVDGDLFEVVVERDGQKPYHLNPRNDIYDHSPTGVAWGYGGSGPAQLALAILADLFTDGKNPPYQRPEWDKEPDTTYNRVLGLYQDFKFAVIARLPMDSGWELTDQQVESVISKIDIERMKTA
jgi:hypothetical protein